LWLYKECPTFSQAARMLITIRGTSNLQNFCVIFYSTCKRKVHPRTGREGPDGEEKYSYTLSLISALDGVDGQRHTPSAVPSEKGPGTRLQYMHNGRVTQPGGPKFGHPWII
jgi:hypothetical protein